MLLEILLFSAAGIAIGIATGLIPGLHPNTIFVMVLSVSFLFAGFPLHSTLAFIISLAVSNTFFDFIPTILLGAPEEDSALSVLPGHRFLLQGNAYEALFLSAVGGLGVMFLAITSLPFLLTSIPAVYGLIKPVMHVLLTAVVLWMIFTERRRLPAVFVFLASGMMGFITLNSLPSEQAMFPAFTGLFGLSTISVSIMKRTRIPEQKIKSDISGEWLKGSLTGWLAGMLAGLLPGIGSSQAGIVAAQALRAKTKEFLIALGGINTSNIFFTFVVFYTIGKTRSGAVWLISQLTDTLILPDLFIIVVIASMTSLISAFLTVRMSRILINRMKNVNYTKIMAFTFTSLIILVLLLSGPLGLLVASTGTFLGLLAISTGIRRTNLMGFLLLPTIAYFSGMSPMLSVVLW